MITVAAAPKWDKRKGALLDFLYVSLMYPNRTAIRLLWNGWHNNRGGFSALSSLESKVLP